MSTGTLTITPAPREVRPAFVAGSVACGLTLVLIVAGLVGSTPLPIVRWAAAFLFFAVASDVRHHRVPNLLTLPALCGAVLVSPWMGGAGGVHPYPAGIAGPR